LVCHRLKECLPNYCQQVHLVAIQKIAQEGVLGRSNTL